MPAPDDVQEVADHRACGRSDDADRARKCGQRAFPLCVKQPLGLQPLFELFKSQLQRARADWLNRFAHQLQLAALRIDAHSAAHQHVQSIFGLEAQQQRLSAKQHHRQLRFGVFQGEVEMARWSGAAV